MSKKLPVEQEYAEQFRKSKPIIFKEKITLYPVLYKDYDLFQYGIFCLLFDQLEFNSEVALKPRLYFLTDICLHVDDVEYVQNNKVLSLLFNSLITLLKLVTHNMDFEPYLNNGNVQLRFFTNKERTEFVDINSKQFEKMREIILHQNGVEYTDEFIHSDIKKWIAEQEKIFKEHSKESDTTDEDVLEAFMLQFNVTDDGYFDTMPIRRFKRLEDKLIKRETYLAQIQGSMSGMVEFKNEIQHWISSPKTKSIYDKYLKEVN